MTSEFPSRAGRASRAPQPRSPAPLSRSSLRSAARHCCRSRFVSGPGWPGLRGDAQPRPGAAGGCADQAPGVGAGDSPNGFTLSNCTAAPRDQGRLGAHQPLSAPGRPGTSWSPLAPCPLSSLACTPLPKLRPQYPETVREVLSARTDRPSLSCSCGPGRCALGPDLRGLHRDRDRSFLHRRQDDVRGRHRQRGRGGGRRRGGHPAVHRGSWTLRIFQRGPGLCRGRCGGLVGEFHWILSLKRSIQEKNAS